MKFTVLLIASCMLAACDSKKQVSNATESTSSQTTATPESNPQETDVEKSCCSEHPAPVANTASEDSIYQIDTSWQDQTGKKRKLTSLGGQIQVITMGYSTCKFACPRLLADMRLIESGLPKKVAAKTGFTFISIDPETDTPARLAEYGKENHIDAPHWTLLTGEMSSVQELAVVLGIQYRKVDQKDFAHSNLITVINANGEIIHRQEGLAADPSDTIKAIIAAQ